MYASLPKFNSTAYPAARKRTVRPLLENLEDRVLLYSTYGGDWVYGNRITYSFAPDGTSVGGTPNALFQTLNAKFPQTTWQLQFQKAAAAWQTAANINLVQVPDDGSADAINGNQQGDPRFGDIRIFMVPLPAGVLGETFLPPPFTGGTNAGDIFLNSTVNWQTSGYDLETVAIHEFGHALGLGETQSQFTTACMYANYNGMKQSLASDDIAGIQSIRSDLLLMSWGDGSGVPTSGKNLVIVGIDNNGLLHIRIYDAAGNRITDTNETKLSATQTAAIATLKQQLPGLLPPHVLTGAEKAQVIGEAASIVGQTQSIWWGTPQPDQFNSNGQHNANFTTAANISSYIDGNGQITLPNLRFTNSGQWEWFSVTVPTNTTGTMVVTEQSTNLSTLSPKLYVYTGALRGVPTSPATGGYGATASITVTNVQAGQTYYIQAGGNAGGAFGLELNFGSQSQLPISPPTTVVPQTPDQGSGVGYSHSQTITIGNISGLGYVYSVNTSLGKGAKTPAASNGAAGGSAKTPNANQTTVGTAALVVTASAQPALSSSGNAAVAQATSSQPIPAPDLSPWALPAIDDSVLTWKSKTPLSLFTKGNQAGLFLN